MDKEELANEIWHSSDFWDSAERISEFLMALKERLNKLEIYQEALQVIASHKPYKSASGLVRNEYEAGHDRAGEYAASVARRALGEGAAK